MIFSKFFSNIQNTPWYRVFLNPVIDEIEKGGKLLDIGTGSGKLLQILASEQGVECVGVDTNADMLKEAEVKLKGTSVTLLQVEVNERLPFNNSEFNNITICSVLFHMHKDDVFELLNDARRILQEDGKIVILTPTGNGNIYGLSKSFLSLKNLSIYIWYLATKNRAKVWMNNNHIHDYANFNKLKYKSQIVMDGFAIKEIIYI